jgi:hypothetical protein
MAIAYVASTIVVTGTGDNVIPGPIDLVGVVVPTAGTVVISKAGVTLETLAAGSYTTQIRSAGGLTVNGACTILLRVAPHSR